MASPASPPPLELLHKRSLKEEVFNLLHARLVAGEYTPGEWLRQEDIAGQLGVSQTPVREALDLLVSAGLAERVLYRGVRVIQPSHAEISDAYAMRLLLEVAAARLAAQNLTPAQARELLAVVEATQPLVTLQDMPQLRQLNRRFHSLIAEYSGSPLLARLSEMAANLFPDWMLYEHLFRRPDLLQPSLEDEYQEHLAIARSIAAGDPDRAALAAFTHLHNLSLELVTFLGIPLDLLARQERQLQPMLPSLNP
jgi:DNA-binding GntR family transcriptional regulator